tara:strand:+ start:1415 stop:1720 length:306 start_codon:yes stop_codon:yes gene_type:complete
MDRYMELKKVMNYNDDWLIKSSGKLEMIENMNKELENERNILKEKLTKYKIIDMSELIEIYHRLDVFLNLGEDREVLIMREDLEYERDRLKLIINELFYTN